MKSSSAFRGFQNSEVNRTHIPTEFFHDLLFQIDHLAELKLTLYVLWALGRQASEIPYLRRTDLQTDPQLLALFHTKGMTAEEALDEALERAVQRGTLLMARTADGTNSERYYFLNGPGGRRTIAAIGEGRWQPSEQGEHVHLKPARPNIFVLYEQNIGALTPLLAERLEEAEAEFPASWIEQAIEIAVANNVRKWRYVEAILENWKTKGKDDEEDRRDLEETRRRYLGGEFAEYIEH